MSTIGRIHSFESCGTVDGPGIRFITFFQGCLMRCLYCHNRDTWDTHGGKEITVEELMKEVVTYRHFMNASGGGVTASGGEAILQATGSAPVRKKVFIPVSIPTALCAATTRLLMNCWKSPIW